MKKMKKLEFLRELQKLQLTVVKVVMVTSNAKALFMQLDLILMKQKPTNGE